MFRSIRPTYAGFKMQIFDASSGLEGIKVAAQKMETNDFLSRVMAKHQFWTKEQTESLSVNYIHLSNQISVASIDPSDLQGVKRMFVQAHSLTGFSLQILSRVIRVSLQGFGERVSENVVQTRCDNGSSLSKRCHKQS